MRRDISSSEEGLTPSQVWDRVEEQLQAMSDEERVGTLKEAGILTKTGRVAKPYRGVLVIKRQPEAKDAAK